MAIALRSRASSNGGLRALKNIWVDSKRVLRAISMSPLPSNCGRNSAGTLRATCATSPVRSAAKAAEGSLTMGISMTSTVGLPLK